MDEFDQAAAQVAGDPMDAAAGAVVDNQRTTLRSALYSSLLENPEVAARAKNLGQRTGLPRDVVQRNLPEVERSVKLDEFDSVLNNSPVLAQWLAKQDNAAIAHDNVESMGAIERKLRQFGGGLGEALGMSASGTGVLADVLQRTAINDFASIFLPEPKRGPMGLEPQKPTIESLAGPLIGEGFRQSGGAIKDFARNDVAGTGEKTFLDQVFGGLGQVTGQVALLPFTRGAGLYAQGADAMNEKIKNDPADQRTKDLAVLGGAAVTGVTEAWALDKLLGPLAVPVKNQLAASLARIGIAAAAEGGQEFSENVLQDTIRKALTNQDAEIDLGQSIGEGGVGAAVGGIVRAVVESALHIRVRGEMKVQKAEEGAQAIAEITDMAKADKLLQRDPVSFEQFIKEAAEGGPVEKVYIDAQTLLQSGVAEQVAQVSPAVAEQLEVAAQTGAQIAIPVEEYTARIAPTDFAQSLIDHLKTDPDGFSRAEAQEYMNTQADQLQAEVDRVLAEKDGDSVFQSSKDTVKIRIKEELDALGRFTPEKNEADATLFASYYAVRAAQLGVTPEQFYEQRKVRFAAQGLTGDFYSQNIRGGFSPESFTITLMRGADLSTNLHEGGHFFFESDIGLAAELANANRALGSDTQTDGERQILSDVSALMKWHGIGGTVEEQLATWYGMDFEQRRALHERTAESFEKYLFEGKAPSLELAPYFQKFRAWMISVYKSIKDFLTQNPEAGKLDDTVRGIFDRMLATSEQIKLAESGRSMIPLFANPEQAGMTPEEFAAYQAQGIEASAEAIDQLQARSLRDLAWTRNARGREIKKLQKQAEARRKEVRMEVRAEVMQEPVYQAWQHLTTEDGGKVYLNPADPYLTPEIVTKLTDFGMTATDGANPDVLAEQFGFTSGDQLLNALTIAPDPDEAIENLTDQRMLERFGELATPEAIEQSADQAIHNEARARMVATEYNALAQAAGQRRVLVDAAKSFAAQVIARLKVRDIQPSRFANAAARAAVNSEKASKSGDIQTAAAEKRNQLLQLQAAKAAHDARDEVERGVSYLKKFSRDGVRKNLDQGYVDQIDALLEKYDLQSNVSQSERRQSLTTWVQSRLNAGEIPAIAESLLTPSERSEYLAQVQSRDDKGDLIYKDDDAAIALLAQAIERSAKRSYKEMTVEEFRGLVDTVKNIEHLGRLKNKILTAREQKQYEQVRDEIAGAIVTNARQEGKNTKTANDWLGQKLQAIKSFGASHIKVATWARIMDGGIDNGPVWKYLVQPANERATMETAMRAEATEALDAIMRPILSKVPMSDKVMKGPDFPSIGQAMNWQERFAVALNVGNESNMQRLLGGKGWTFAQIKPVLDTLTADEWMAVQAIWDHFESYRPLIAEKELRVTGKEPEWIQARRIDVTTSDGQRLQLRGGYFPVVFDPRMNMKAEADAKSNEAKDLLKAAYSAATTRRGFIKQRVDELNGRPLLLNLQGLYSAVNDVIHDLAWHEWVIDANKLLKSKTIDNAIREHYGPEVKREFDRWRDDIVIGTRRMDDNTERAIGYLRQSISASALTFNLLTAAMQPLGLANSVSRVGAQWIGKGVARYVSSPFESTREAQSKSKWLANRTRTRFRELNELRNQVQGQTAAKELMGRYGYWLMMRTQMMVDVPTWWAGYEKAISEGHDEATAVQLADQGVKDAQGGGEEVDQSGIERGGPYVKIFTTFYSYMGSTLNVAYLSGKTETSKAKAIANILLVTMTPAILGALMKDALVPGGDDKDEDLLKKLAAEQVGFLLGMVVVGREFSQAAKMAFGEYSPGYGGPAGLRTIGDITKLTQQTAQGEFDDGFRRAFVSVLGDLTGIPAVQINKTWNGAQAISEGETDSPAESAAALVFGFQR